MLNRLKRFLALALTAFMFINMLPMSALADEVATWSLTSTYASTYALSNATQLEADASQTITGDAEYKIYVGDTVSLKVTGNYNGDYNNEAGWTESDTGNYVSVKTSKSGMGSDKTYTATVTGDKESGNSYATLTFTGKTGGPQGSTTTTYTVKIYVAAKPASAAISGTSTIYIDQTTTGALTVSYANMPDGVTVSSSSWTVSNSDKATISGDKDGATLTLTENAVSGDKITVTFTAKLSDGTELTATYEVSVSDYSVSVYNDPTILWATDVDIEGNANNSKTIEGAACSGSSTNNYFHTWISSDSDAVGLTNASAQTVTATAKSAQKLGTFTLTHQYYGAYYGHNAQSASYGKLSELFVVIVYGAHLNEISDMYIGGTAQASYTSKLPSGAQLSWTSSNADVATVDANGVITAVSAGTATITLKVTHGGATVSVSQQEVTVNGDADYSVSPTKMTLYKGASDTATVSTDSSSASLSAVQWNSSDTEIATVQSSDNGATLTVAAGNKLGDAAIIGVCPDGEILLIEVSVIDVSLKVQPANTDVLSGSSCYVYTEVEAPSGYQLSVVSSDENKATATLKDDGSIEVQTISGQTGSVTLTVTLTSGTATIEKTVTLNLIEGDSEASYYTVKFYDYYGNLIANHVVASGAEVEVPEITDEVEGYTYQGFPWNDGYVRNPAKITVMSDLILVASYAINEYTVTYHSNYPNGSDSTTTKQVAYRGVAEELDAPDAPDAPSDAYSFVGWYYKEGENFKEYNFLSPITGNLDLYAKWESTVYTITLIAHTGVVARYYYNCVDGKWYSNEALTETVSTSNIKFPNYTSGDNYSYTIYGVTNSYSKTAYFQFWQQSDAITSYKGDVSMSSVFSYVTTNKRSVIFNAVYEPSKETSTENNAYHTNKADVTVQLVKENGDVIGETVIPIPVIPAYGNKTLVSAFASDTYTKNVTASTAKFGTLNIETLLNDKITIGNTTYTVVDLSQIRTDELSVVWLCQWDYHVYGGGCGGGTWNPLGILKIIVRENVSDSAQLCVNYIIVDDENKTNELSKTTQIYALEAGDLLYHGSYEAAYAASSNLYCLGEEWIAGYDGATAENGKSYVLNLYYCAKEYKVKVYYYDESKGKIEDAILTTENPSKEVTGLKNGWQGTITTPATLEKDGVAYARKNSTDEVISYKINGDDVEIWVPYVQAKGTLTIHKTLIGDLPAEKDGKYVFDFSVMNDDGTTVATVSVPVTQKTGETNYTGSASVELTTGEYTVIETTTMTATGLAYYTTYGADNTVNITSGGTATVNVTNQQSATSVTVTKVWNDSDNQDGIRPTSVTVKLYADGEESGDAVTLNEDNSWTYTWTGLAKNASGTAIAYTVDETSTLPTGYSKSITGNATTGYTITNSYEPATTSVSVTKVWSDADNQDGIRPTSVTVQLKANGTESGEAVTLSAANGWTYTWTGLAKNANGAAITYTVDETKIGNSAVEDKKAAGYTVTITGSAEEGFVITNTHETEKTSVKVTKEWSDAENQDGIRPSSVTVKLLADNADTGKTVTLNEDNEWTASFNGLAVNKAGKAIAYTVEETNVPTGYTAAVTGDAATGYNITNSYTPATTSVTVTKAWNDSDNQDGIRPSSVTVQLYANGTASGDAVTLSATNSWTYTWTGLAKNADGTAIAYTVDETSELPDGYSKSITGSATTGYTITNTHETEKTSVSVTKVWDDANDQDGIRPTSVTVKLLADNADTGKSVTLNAANGWTASFENLDKYKAGKSIVYSVAEVEVKGYTAAITGDATEGYTITNSYTPETTDISVTKSWVDDNNKYETRPESITVNLLANGTKVASAIVKADAEGKWNCSFTDQPVYANGEKITYTVMEDAVTGYTPSISGFAITNTIEQGKVGYTGWKQWNLIEGETIPDVTITLKRDGVVIASKTLTSEDVDTIKTNVIYYDFSNLPKHAVGEIDGYTGEYDGHLFTYSVSESEVPGYVGDQDGLYFTNTAIEATVEVTKNWVDGDGNALDEKLIPRELKVQLMRNDVAYRDPVILTAENRTEESVWSYTFTGLPTHDAQGNAYTYSVKETVPDGFTAEDDEVEVVFANGNVEGEATLTNTKDDTTPTDPSKKVSELSEIYMEGTTEQVKLGGEITYTISYFNHLNTAATVTIEDSIPAGTEYVSSTNGGAYADGKVKWTLDAAPFTEGEVQLIVRVTEDALKDAVPNPQIENTATVQLGNNSSVEVDAEGVPVYNPVLNLEKEETTQSADGEAYRLGETIGYKITLSNEGNVTLKDIQVTDSRISVDDMTLAAKEGITFENGKINAMEPGDVVVLTYSCTVTEAMILEAGKAEPKNTVLNSAVAKAENPGEPDEPLEPGDDVTVEVEEPDGHLSITKETTGKPANGERYVLGEKITYKIVVKNDGNLTIENIVVKDELTKDEWKVGTLKPGESSTAYEAEYIVTEADLYNEKVVNVATGTGESPDPDEPDVPVEPGETEDPTEEAKPAYTVVKKLTNEPANGEGFELGETAEFEITVTNTGNLTLNNIVVKEELAGAIFADGKAEATIATLKPGEKTVLKAQYTIAEEDLGNEALANTLTSSATTPDPENPDGPEKPVEPDPIDPVPIPVDDEVRVGVEKIWDDAENALATRPETITVKLLADGEVYKTAQISADADGKWSFSFERLPMHRNGERIDYSVAEDAVTGYDAAYEQVEGGWKITNTIRKYTLTVRYWHEKIGGQIAAATFTRTYSYGESYMVKSPYLAGYKADLEAVSGAITEDAEFDVIYTPIDFKLTVRYVYEDGTTAHPTYRQTLKMDESYLVYSPVLEGYTASITRVSGKIVGHNVEYTVIYVPDTTIIEDYDVPLNLGSVTMNVGDCFE